ncbi:FecR family protein [Butyricimonas paravirosa]|uniref:FecR family protein n=1 Tax=Butyricimonas paravirosa TaxID=1472417 RepID=UPI0022DFC92A|nr:FecR family protein [Butyricimonas paravirosa]
MKEKLDKIEFILEHLREPEQLLQKEFVSWLQEEENKHLFEEVTTNRMAFLQKEYGQQIEPELEWQKLWQQMQKDSHTPIPEKRKINRRVWYSVAAGVCVLTALAGGLLLQQGKEKKSVSPMAQIEHVGKRSAQLIVSTGEVLDLSQEKIYQKAVDGTLITNDTLKLLSYQSDTQKTTIIRTGDAPEKIKKETVYHTLRIPAGADYQVTLADGTKVWLNCESTLQYPVEFGDEKREVYLDGEGYFEVNKATEWPFIVNTEQMQVKVTGTKFNVKSYSTELIVHTTLVEGSVWAYTDQTQVQLTPSEQFRYDKETGKTSVQKVDTELYTGWIEGMFVFRNQRLEDVMNDLARWYNMTIFYSTAETKEIRISTNLNRYKNIDDLLEIINESGKVVVARKDNTITIHAR